MFGKQVTLFKLMGFRVRMDVSWLIIAVLITWTLAEGVFRAQFGEQPAWVRWTMGVGGALGLFLSIVLHEFSHSIVARRYGLPIKGITLFIFGGVAEMTDEPPSAKAEFMMAIAGPISSLVIAAIFGAFGWLGAAMNWPTTAVAVLGYLALINVVLVIFNMIPGFPLDGGRVLRSALWAWKGDLRWATRMASGIGAAFGWVLIGLGVLSFITGALIAGIWWFLIGMFIRYAAKQSYAHVLVRQALEGEPVRRFMNPNPVTVRPETDLQHLVDDFVYRYHYKMFPVVDEHGVLTGCVTTENIKDVPREQWGEHTVSELTATCSNESVVSPNDESVDALNIMNKSQKSRLLVVENNHLAGVITLKDLLKFLSLKLELEGGDAAAEAHRIIPTPQ